MNTVKSVLFINPLSDRQPMSVLETAGIPVTGGPPMLMSNAVYFSWRSIYGLNN